MDWIGSEILAGLVRFFQHLAAQKASPDFLSVSGAFSGSLSGWSFSALIDGDLSYLLSQRA